jgi:hypothetical protein
MQNLHRIDRQEVLLALAGPMDAHALQQQSAEALRAASSEMERLFDAVAGPETTLRIERLELDLGEIDPGQFVELFRARLVEALAEALGPGALGSDTGIIQGKESVPTVMRRWQAWQQYLETGVVPWQEAAWFKEGEEFPEWIFREVSESERNEILLALRRYVLANPVALARLATVYFDWVETKVLPVWAGVQVQKWYSFLRTVWGVFQDHHPGQIPPHRWREAVVEVWALYAEPTVSFDEMGIQGVVHLTQRLPALRVIFSQRPPVISSFGLPDFPSILEKVGVAGEKQPSGPERTPDKPTLNYSKPAAPVRQKDQSLWTPVAGLVLLHPFLEVYFREVNLYDGTFAGFEAQARAAQLAAWLATGREATPAHAMALPALLAGLRPEALLPDQPPFTDFEKKEGLQLLEAVTAHWTALKSTSPDGLREGFLMREGKLTRMDNGWSLTVETKAQDVLLGYLPWGIGLIRLPWMDEMLEVNWT